MRRCRFCKSEFEITGQDQAFYSKINVPEPTLCPDCRCQRRMTFRNERHLYQRNCDKCKKKFLSIYDNVPFDVYCYDCWWSEGWSSLQYGQDYDPKRPFFEQFGELVNKVPYLGIVTSFCENSDYANYTNYSKNCYLVFGCHAAENCYYGWRMHDSLNCIDCAQINKSKYCYECVDCDECYELFYSQDCNSCSGSAFLYDCRSCQDCLFCAGLRNQQYCIFNKQYSKEDYFKYKASLDFASNKVFLELEEKFSNWLKTFPRREIFVSNSENVSGDHISNCQNVRAAFNVKNVQDGAYLESCEDLKDAMDSTFCGWPAELNYEGISGGCVNSYNCKFVVVCWSCANLEYCDSCHNSKDLFGCFGLHNKNQFCILNKQYGEDEYLELKKKIIENFKEYGEFFNSALSPFSYNETVANEFYPLSKERALSLGFKWKEVDAQEYQPNKELSVCEQCGKNYKIIALELEFYKKYGIRLPAKCFGCRHQNRMNKRNSRKLYERKCGKCLAEIMTTYSPDRSEIVYCERCYMRGIY
ncbi:MAG: hypothetical protein AAB373_00435 [Patescibacteria group bacterium]